MRRPSHKFRTKLFIAASIITVLATCRNQVGNEVSMKELYNLRLSTLNNDVVLFEDSKKTTAYVFVFLSPDCPISQRYAPVLNNLYDSFSSKGFEFYAVIPGVISEYTSAENFHKDHKLGFSVVIDEHHTLTNLLQATVTPEVFVLDKKGKVYYSGRIDNWFVSLGKKRTVVTEENLKNALKSLIEMEPIETPRTEPIGCYIYPVNKKISE